MSEIVLENVTKRWEETTAVKDVSFCAGKGELLVILGPSGCGKSTVLRMIAGLEEVTQGRILITGKDATCMPAAERNVSMVFQSYALFPHMTVADNILFGLQFRKVPKGEQARRLSKVTEMLSLSGLENRKPGQLSGGQRQRVALGRAIVAQTPVCLMDEPLSNLDAKLRNTMRTEIRSLQQRLGMTMAYVTHDQTEAMSMADQIVLMNNGTIVQAGTPTQIYNSPASVFAARFIGTPPMNLMDLSAVDPEGKMPRLVDGNADNLVYGVRPEHIRLTRGEGMPATVVSSEYLGADTMITCRIGKNEVVLRQPDQFQVGPGESVTIAWDIKKAHLFDGKTGLRRDQDLSRLLTIEI